MANPNAGKLLLIGGGLAAGTAAALWFKQKMDEEDGENSMYDVPLSKLRSKDDQTESQSGSDDTKEEKSEGGWFSMGKTETKDAANCPPSHFKRVHKPCSSIWNTSNENDGDNKGREKRSFFEDVFGGGEEGEADQSIIDKIKWYFGFSGSDDEDRSWFGKSKEGGGSWFGGSSEDEGSSWFGSGSQDKEEGEGWFGKSDEEESSKEKVEESSWLGKTDKDAEDKPWFGEKDKDEEDKTWFGKKEEKDEDQGWFGSKDKEEEEKPWFGSKDKEEDSTWFGNKEKVEDSSWFGSKDKEDNNSSWFGSGEKEKDSGWLGLSEGKDNAKNTITEKVEEGKKWLNEQGEGAKELLQGKKDVSNENKEKPCFFSPGSKGQAHGDGKKSWFGKDSEGAAQDEKQPSLTSWFGKDGKDAAQEEKESALTSWFGKESEGAAQDEKESALTSWFGKDNESAAKESDLPLLSEVDNEDVSRIDNVKVQGAPSPVGISQEIDDENAGKMVIETAAVSNPQSEDDDDTVVKESSSSAPKTSFFESSADTSESKEQSSNCPCDPEPQM